MRHLRLLLLPALSWSSCLWQEDTLSCRQADLTTLEASIGATNTSALGIIDVFSCSLPWLGENIFTGLSLVTEVTLRSSSVASLHGGALDPFTRLLSLDLSGNLLSSLPLALTSLASLRSLDLQGNQLSSIDPDILANLTSLAHLNLAGNLLHLSEDLDLSSLSTSLTSLVLASNSLPRLPSTFQKSFPLLRHLDLSSNLLSSLPTSLLSHLPQLEHLLLNHNQLTNLVLEPLLPSLSSLSLLGNRLRCDCKSLWLRRTLEAGRPALLLPPCFSPFSRNTLQLGSFEGTSLCSLADQTRLPKFFRVTEADREHFPRNTFSSLALLSAAPSSLRAAALDIAFSIQLEFYYNEFDWGVIYREMGAGGGRSEFYKTKLNLRDQAAANPDWSPRQEEDSFELSLPSATSCYEVCLAVVEQGATYYLHQDLCLEVSPRPPSPPLSPPILVTNLTVVPALSSITVGWELLATGTAVVRQISVRKFGEVEEERVLVRDEQGDTAERTRLYTVSGLEAGAGYTVCFATIYGEEGGQEGAREGAKCREVNTLQPDFPVPEVAAAAAVSTSVSSLVVALVCCCCFPCRRKAKGKNRGLDLNENEKGKAEARDKLFHQRYVGEGCGGMLCLPCVGPGGGSCSPEESRESSSPGEESVYSQIRPPASLPHSCPHSVPVEKVLEEGQGQGQKGRQEMQERKERKERKAASLTVRSAHSLSSKYSERRLEATKRYLRKNSSLCIQPDKEGGHHCAPPDPPNTLPDGSRIKTGPVLASPPSYPRDMGVLRKRLQTPLGRYHTVSSHSHHQFYKRGLPLQYYTPQPEYFPAFSHSEVRRAASTSNSRPKPSKYYPATFSHTPLELRPVKMKKSLKKSPSKEQAKMYTWSPYSSSLFYSEPAGQDCVTIKTGEELRF